MNKTICVLLVILTLSLLCVKMSAQSLKLEAVIDMTPELKNNNESIHLNRMVYNPHNNRVYMIQYSEISRTYSIVSYEYNAFERSFQFSGSTEPKQWEDFGIIGLLPLQKFRAMVVVRKGDEQARVYLDLITDFDTLKPVKTYSLSDDSCPNSSFDLTYAYDEWTNNKLYIMVYGKLSQIRNSYYRMCAVKIEENDADHAETGLSVSQYSIRDNYEPSGSYDISLALFSPSIIAFGHSYGSLLAYNTTDFGFMKVNSYYFFQGPEMLGSIGNSLIVKLNNQYGVEVMNTTLNVQQRASVKGYSRLCLSTSIRSDSILVGTGPLAVNESSTLYLYDKTDLNIIQALPVETGRLLHRGCTRDIRSKQTIFTISSPNRDIPLAKFYLSAYYFSG